MKHLSTLTFSWVMGLSNNEDDMDLAMMCGVFIFGTFGAGTLLFLYGLRP
jgi:hypothetical protein